MQLIFQSLKLCTPAKRCVGEWQGLENPAALIWGLNLCVACLTSVKYTGWLWLFDKCIPFLNCRTKHSQGFSVRFSTVPFLLYEFGFESKLISNYFAVFFLFIVRL